MPDFEDFTPAKLPAGNLISSVRKVRAQPFARRSECLCTLVFYHDDAQFLSVLQDGASLGGVL